MAQITSGNTATISLGETDSITVTTRGAARFECPAGTTIVEFTGTRTFGPFDNTSAKITALTGDLYYEYADGSTSYPVTATAQELAGLGALLSGAGNPTDQMTGVLQRVTITGALSTTATQTATATGTYTKARVVWNNNGASGSAKLRIAVNADNAVHGLVAGQSAKRRDYEMTMGDGVMLVCGIPITSLTFSADSAIAGAAHQLQVTFGN